MHTYYDAKDMLKKELDEIVRKGELSAGSLDTIDKILSSIVHACKIIMYEEYAEDGYSYADGDRDMSEYSYARGNGRGRGSQARRDSMGRYSSEGGYSNARGGRDGRDGRGGYSRRSGYSYADGEKEEKIELIRDMMEEVSSDEERRALQKIMRRYEQE
jgi:hypothetical protein